MTSDVRIAEKYALTIEEASAYYNIGQGKIRELLNTCGTAKFYIKVGNKSLIKREAFGKYLDKLTEI